MLLGISSIALNKSCFTFTPKLEALAIKVPTLMSFSKALRSSIFSIFSKVPTFNFENFCKIFGLNDITDKSLKYVIFLFLKSKGILALLKK